MTMRAIARLTLFGLGLSCGAVFATEGGQFAGPVGGSDIRSAYLPPFEGWYAATFAGMSRGHKYTGTDGQSSPAAPNGRISLNYAGAALMYRYPGTYWGGSLASTVSLYQSWNVYMRIGETTDHAESQMGDMYTDLLAWSRHLGAFGAKPGAQGSTPYPLPYGLTVMPALSLVAPIGSYDVDRFANVGRNTWVYAPNVSLTYLTGPDLSFGDGTELSARFYYQVSRKNSDSGYRNGDVAVMDWAVSQRWGHWQAGLTGTIAKQYSDDQLHGEDVPGGNRMYVSSAGPLVNYEIPGTSAFVKFKAIYPLHEVNRMSYRFALLQLGFKL